MGIAAAGRMGEALEKTEKQPTVCSKEYKSNSLYMQIMTVATNFQLLLNKSKQISVAPIMHMLLVLSFSWLFV